MARNDLYLHDGARIFKLPANHLTAGNDADDWHVLGSNAFVGRRWTAQNNGDWWTSNINAAGDPTVTQVYGEHDTARIANARGATVVLYRREVNFQPGQAANLGAIKGLALLQDGRIMVTAETNKASRLPVLMVEAQDGTGMIPVFNNRDLPLEGGQFDITEAMALRQSDGLIALARRNEVWWRWIYEDYAGVPEAIWRSHTFARDQEGIDTDIVAMSFAGDGSLWLFDAGHVRVMRQQREFASGWASTVEWTLPEQISGQVNREAIRGFWVDQRGGRGNMALGGANIIGAALGETVLLDGRYGANNTRALGA